ncbi:hypothetical protein BGW41_005061, partial [Actinomortierella wolfii]
MAASTLPRFKRRAPAADSGEDTTTNTNTTAPLVPADPDIIDVTDADDKEKSSPVNSGSEEHSCEPDDEESDEDTPPLDDLIDMATTRVAETERQLRQILARLITLEATKSPDSTAVAQAKAKREAAIAERDSAKRSLDSLLSMRPQNATPASSGASLTAAIVTQDGDPLPYKHNISMPNFKKDSSPVEFIKKMERRLTNLMGAETFN